MLTIIFALLRVFIILYYNLLCYIYNIYIYDFYIDIRRILF